MSLFHATPRLIASRLSMSTEWESLSLPLRAELGRNAHRQIRAEHPDWRAEVPLFSRIKLGSGQIIELHGRADFINRDPHVAEVVEVKSVCLSRDQFHSASNPPDQFHIQTSLYAWMFNQAHHDFTPSDVTARLICLNLTDGSRRSFQIVWSPEAVIDLLETYAFEVATARKLLAVIAKSRRESSRRLFWPFPTRRPIQSGIEEALSAAWTQGDNILIEAPTGCGKTSAILFPALKLALKRNRQTYYATAKTSGRNPVSNTVSPLFEQAPDLKVMILASREEICSLADRAGLCNACRHDSTEFIDPTPNELQPLFQGGIVTPQRIVQFTEQQAKSIKANTSNCPYRISRLAVDQADLVIGDINYVYDPAVMLDQFRGDLPLKWTLLIDEAHNLPDRACEMNSVKIDFNELKVRFERLMDDYWRYDDPAAEELVSVYTSLIELVSQILSEAPEESIATVEPHSTEWQDLASGFGATAGQLLARAVSRIDADVNNDIWQTYSELKSLALRSSKDTDQNIHYADALNQIIGIGCIDAAENLAQQNRRFHSIAAFSATLSPVEESMRSLGLSLRGTAISQFQPPALEEGRLLVLHASGVDTRQKSRLHTSGRVAAIISRFARLSPGGVLAVFPSFDYIQLVAPLVAAKGVEVIIQHAGMSGVERAAFRQQLINRTGPLAAFVVAGGQFTEAEDFPDDQVTGVVVVGPCLPPPDFWKEEISRDHQERGDNGTLIAYFNPAIRKVVQAAGRMLRLETDRGVVLLMDDRYLFEPLHPLLPVGWQQLISRQSTDWETAVTEFWGMSPIEQPSFQRPKRRKSGRSH